MPTKRQEDLWMQWEVMSAEIKGAGVTRIDSHQALKDWAIEVRRLNTKLCNLMTAIVVAYSKDSAEEASNKCPFCNEDLFMNGKDMMCKDPDCIYNCATEA